MSRLVSTLHKVLEPSQPNNCAAEHLPVRSQMILQLTELYFAPSCKIGVMQELSVVAHK